MSTSSLFSEIIQLDDDVDIIRKIEMIMICLVSFNPKTTPFMKALKLSHERKIPDYFWPHIFDDPDIHKNIINSAFINIFKTSSVQLQLLIDPLANDYGVIMCLIPLLDTSFHIHNVSTFFHVIRLQSMRIFGHLVCHEQDLELAEEFVRKIYGGDTPPI